MQLNNTLTRKGRGHKKIISMYWVSKKRSVVEDFMVLLFLCRGNNYISRILSVQTVMIKLPIKIKVTNRPSNSLTQEM